MCVFLDHAAGITYTELSAGGGFRCSVASSRMLAPLIREIVLTLPEDRSSAFRAGDFMQITAPPFALDFQSLDVPEAFRDTWKIAGWFDLAVGSEQEVTRAYSLASRPEDAGTAVFNIRLAVPPAGAEAPRPVLAKSHCAPIRALENKFQCL